MTPFLLLLCSERPENWTEGFEVSGPSGRGGTAVGGPQEPLLERGPRCCRQPHSGGRRPRLRGPWGGVTAHCLGVGGGRWCLWEGSVEELLACLCPRGGDSGCSHSGGEEGRRSFADVLRIQRWGEDRESWGAAAWQRAAAFPARGFAKAATGWPRWASVCPQTWMHRGRLPAPGRGGLCEDRPRRGLRHSQRRVRASRAATIWECNCDSRKRTLRVPDQASLSPPKAWCRGFAGRARCRFTFGHGVPALAPRRNPRGGSPTQLPGDVSQPLASTCWQSTPQGGPWSVCPASGAAHRLTVALTVLQVPILVPCHRVVCSSGAVGNYIGGPAVKEWLLTHEGSLAGRLAHAGGTRPAQASQPAGRSRVRVVGARE